MFRYIALGSLFAALVACVSPRAHDQLVVVNQTARVLQLVDPVAKQAVLTVSMGINPHEVAVSRDGRFVFAPIYGSGGVGQAGTDGDTIEVVDLSTGEVQTIALGAGVRPHDIKVGSDGMLYVSAELANAVFVVDPAAKAIVARIPTGQPQSHNIALSPDGRWAFTSNVSTGSVSVLDIRNRRLVGVVPVDERVQRVSVSPNGRRVFTHIQNRPLVAVIDPKQMKVVDHYQLPQPGFTSAVTPDGKTLVVAGVAADRTDPGGSGELYLVDLASRSVVTYRVPGRPRVVLISSDGRLAWVVFANTGRIAAVDLATGALTHMVGLAPGLDGMALRPRRVR